MGKRRFAERADPAVDGLEGLPARRQPHRPPVHADERYRSVPLGCLRDGQGGLTAEDIDVFVPHQANARINELLARNLKLREGVPVADDIEYTGNTAAASIPLAMYELLKSGRAKPGDTALLLGYGAGLSYSGQIVAMPPAPVV